MKYFAVSAAAAVLLASAFPVQASSFVFSTFMTAANEPSNNGSPATGTATVTFDDVAQSVTVFQSWSNLTSAITINHIHCCTAAAGTGTSGTVIDFSPSTAVSGSYNATFVAGTTSNFTLAEFPTLLAGTLAGKAYVNIHTVNNGGGEIRGFLAPVPEPETYALMLAGLGLTGWAVRRRRAARPSLSLSARALPACGAPAP